MAIKTSKMKLTSIIIFLMIPLLISTFNINSIKVLSNEPLLFSDPKLKFSNEVFIDKVYNFTIDRPYHLFEDIPFKAEYNHYVLVDIVTPHVGHVSINITDPEGTIYEVFFKGNMTQSVGMMEIPFGAAITGPHNILISIELNYNLNMRVKIIRDCMCLQDMLSNQEWANRRQYGVGKYDELESIIKQVALTTDTMYKLFFSRVSAISSLIVDNVVKFNYSLNDNFQNILFEINWEEVPMVAINHMTKYDFGTASAGMYETNLTVFCGGNPVNVAYAVVYSHVIGDILDEHNDTEPIDYEDSDILDFIVSIPQELMIGTSVFALGLTGVVVGMTVNKKKKNAMVR